MVNSIHGEQSAGNWRNIFWIYGKENYSLFRHTRLTELNPSSPAIVIRGGSQGNDLGPITDEDSAQLLAAKRQITEVITQWVQEA